MKILFDQGVPKPLQTYLSTHEVLRAFQLGWARKKNGDLIALAESAGFQVLVTPIRIFDISRTSAAGSWLFLSLDAVTGRKWNLTPNELLPGSTL